MMRKILFGSAMLAAATVLAASTAFAGPQQSYDFSGFDELDVAAGIEVVYKSADQFSVSADFRRGGPEDLKIHQDGDRLYISKKLMSGGRDDQLRVTLTVTSPELNAVEASSGSSVKAEGVASDAFALKVSSGASVEISGTCGNLALKVSSGGSANARELICERVTANASSGGSADAYASVQASSKTSSGGSIEIWGNPSDRSANKSISGGSTSFH